MKELLKIINECKTIIELTNRRKYIQKEVLKLSTKEKCKIISEYAKKYDELIGG